MRGFFLRVTGKKASGHLYYRFNREGVGMTIWTGINVDVKKWDAAIQSPTKWSDYTSEERFIDDEGKECFRPTEGSRVKHLMDDIVGCVNKIISEDKGQKGADGKISEEDKLYFQKSIDNIVNREAYEQKKKADVDNLNHIIAFYEWFMKGIESGELKHHDGVNYAEGSVKQWKSFRNLLYDLVNEHMTFEMIDKFFVDKFHQYLDKKIMFGNTKNQKIGQMRKLCALATEYGKNNSAYSVAAWKAKPVGTSDKRTSIYLTDEEIDALYNLKLEGKMATVRDMFFVGCMTCQRYSDFSRISKSMFRKNNDGVPVICITQKKTGSYVEIPVVDDRIMEVFERHNYKFPQIRCEHFETFVRMIARELAKAVPSLNEIYITKLTMIETKAEKNYARLLAKKEKGERLNLSERLSLKHFLMFRTCYDGIHLWERDEQGNVLKPKYALISTHTARRSGITNLYKTGLFDSRELRSMSGHRSDKVLDIYIKTTTSEQSTRIYDKLTKLKNERTAKGKAQRVRLNKAV